MKSLKWSVLFVIMLFVSAGLISCGGGGGSFYTMADLSVIRAALGENNPYGMVPGLPLGEITLPACTGDTGSARYSLDSLPSWLAFNSTSREVTLSEGAVIPDNAYAGAEVTYSCSGESVTFTINDLDGGGAVDGQEYVNGAVPLLNQGFGWIALTPDNVDLYRTTAMSLRKIPTGLTKVEIGMDPTDASDDTSDFDGDAAVTGGGTNDVELANGTNIFVVPTSGGFSSTANYAFGGGQGIAAADFDRDGHLDIVTSNPSDGASVVSVAMGVGDGSFGAATTYAISNKGRRIVTADFNEDGYADLAVSNYDIAPDDPKQIVSVLLNNGDGTFGAQVEYDIGLEGPWGITAADLNGDDHVDLAVLAAKSTLTSGMSVMFGTGNGTFGAPTTYTNLGGGNKAIVAADLDADGDLDLIATAAFYGGSGSGDHISVFLNNGDGTFGSAGTYLSGGTGSASGLAIADFDMDGNLDLATCRNSNLLISLGAGDGSFGTAASYDTGAQGRDVVAADMNGDGYVDVVVTNGMVNTYLNDGDGLFTFLESNVGGAGAWYITGADFDKDGAIDIGSSNVTADNATVMLQ